jgi:hypothetical protein
MSTSNLPRWLQFVLQCVGFATEHFRQVFQDPEVTRAAICPEAVSGDNQFAKRANQFRDVSFDLVSTRLDVHLRGSIQDVLHDREESKRVCREQVDRATQTAQLFLAIVAVRHTLNREVVTTRAGSFQVSRTLTALAYVRKLGEAAAQRANVVEHVAKPAEQPMTSSCWSFRLEDETGHDVPPAIPLS